MVIGGIIGEMTFGWTSLHGEGGGRALRSSFMGNYEKEIHSPHSILLISNSYFSTRPAAPCQLLTENK